MSVWTGFHFWKGTVPIFTFSDAFRQGRGFEIAERSFILLPIMTMSFVFGAITKMEFFAYCLFGTWFFIMFIGVFSWPKFLMVPQARTHPGELAMWRAKRKGQPIDWKPDYDVEKVRHWQQRKLDSGQIRPDSMLFNHPELSWSDPRLDKTKFNQKQAEKLRKKKW